jgi:hypothetical protein
MRSALWNNPSGGIRYHFRAWRRRDHAWLPFREQLEAWLADWRPRATTLAIVGPSGGYCLPLRALQGFQRFVIFEPDPLARAILKRRMRAALPQRELLWVGDDVWVGPLLRGGSIPRALLGGETALLFSNIIGQLSYMVDDAAFPAWRQAWCQSLFPQLERMPWASFHDRVSSEIAPHKPLPTHGRRLSDAEITALYQPAPGETIELNDHHSQELLPEGHGYRYLHWPLTETMHHVIECVLGGPE